MEKKQMQVYLPVKRIVEDLKKKIGLKNESQVIAYLYALYDDRLEKITLIEHEKALKRITEIHNQNSF